MPIQRRRACSDACATRRHAEQFAQWRSENADHRAAYTAKWRSENAAWIKAWNEANREMLRFRKAASQRRRRARSREGYAITARDLRRLVDRAQGRCAYCCASFTEVRLSIEHVVPLSRGGSDSVANIVAACLPCNQQKHAKTVTEWRMWRRRLGMPELAAFR